MSEKILRRGRDSNPELQIWTEHELSAKNKDYWLKEKIK